MKRFLSISIAFIAGMCYAIIIGLAYILITKGEVQSLFDDNTSHHTSNKKLIWIDDNSSLH